MLQHPTFEHGLAWLKEGAIAPDPATDPRGTVGDDALNRRARLFKAVFDTADGQLVLQTILEASLFRAAVDHRLQGEEYLRFAQLRQGQNQMAATILAYLSHAEALERKPRGPEPEPEYTAARGSAASWPGGPVSLRAALEPEPGGTAEPDWSGGDASGPFTALR